MISVLLLILKQFYQLKKVRSIASHTAAGHYEYIGCTFTRHRREKFVCVESYCSCRGGCLDDSPFISCFLLYDIAAVFSLT